MLVDHLSYHSLWSGKQINLSSNSSSILHISSAVDKDEQNLAITWEDIAGHIVKTESNGSSSSWIMFVRKSFYEPGWKLSVDHGPDDWSDFSRSKKDNLC